TQRRNQPSSGCPLCKPATQRRYQPGVYERALADPARAVDRQPSAMPLLVPTKPGRSLADLGAATMEHDGERAVERLQPGVGARWQGLARRIVAGRDVAAKRLEYLYRIACEYVQTPALEQSAQVRVTSFEHDVVTRELCVSATEVDQGQKPFG